MFEVPAIPARLVSMFAHARDEPAAIHQDTMMSVPDLDAKVLFDGDGVRRAKELEKLRAAAVDVGFMTLRNTTLDATAVTGLLDVYRRFFLLPTVSKRPYDMAVTGSNRGWGASGAEQVDPNANPDFKEVFDAGPELGADDPLVRHTYYAPNLWPDEPADFRAIVTDYYRHATQVALKLLSAIAEAIGESADHFADAFDKPMALLRGNYYPPRPAYAGASDFGIAAHTDYGCLTLLATDGSPGLEIASRNGRWVPVTAPPGIFAVNFGEMLERWTRGRIVATPHRVIGGVAERLSAPLFFNPRYDVNIAPPGSTTPEPAGPYLARRYDETYVHRQAATTRG